MKKIFLFLILLFGFIQNTFAIDGTDIQGDFIYQMSGVNQGNIEICRLDTRSNGTWAKYVKVSCYDIEGNFIFSSDELSVASSAVDSIALSESKFINLNNGSGLYLVYGKNNNDSADFRFIFKLNFNNLSGIVKYKDNYIKTNDLKVYFYKKDGKNYIGYGELGYNIDDDILINDVEESDYGTNAFSYLESNLINVVYNFDNNTYYTFLIDNDTNLRYYNFDTKENNVFENLTSFYNDNMKLYFNSVSDNKVNFYLSISPVITDYLQFDFTEKSLTIIKQEENDDKGIFIGVNKDNESLYYKTNSINTNIINKAGKIGFYSIHNSNFAYYNNDDTVKKWEYSGIDVINGGNTDDNFNTGGSGSGEISSPDLDSILNTVNEKFGNTFNDLDNNFSFSGITDKLGVIKSDIDERLGLNENKTCKMFNDDGSFKSYGTLDVSLTFNIMQGNNLDYILAVPQKFINWITNPINNLLSLTSVFETFEDGQEICFLGFKEKVEFQKIFKQVNMGNATIIPNMENKDLITIGKLTFIDYFVLVVFGLFITFGVLVVFSRIY